MVLIRKMKRRRRRVSDGVSWRDGDSRMGRKRGMEERGESKRSGKM